MSEGSKIEWCDDTMNFWRGCKKVSDGCAHCYAEISTPVRVARSKGRELWGGTMRDRAQDLDAPLRWNKKPWVCETCGKPDDKHQDHSCTGRKEDSCHTANVQWHRRRVFSLSLGDWLDPDVPIEWLADMLRTIHDTPNLDWLLLTKRPENFRKRIAFSADELWDRYATEDDRRCDIAREWLAGNAPKNIWLGTTVENQAMADKRIPLLLQIPAKVRFLSVEPMLGPISLPLTKPIPIHDDVYGDQHEYHEVNAGIHWIICGGESGSKKRPFDCDWARSIRAQCEEYSIPFFFKQVDKIRPIPEDLMIRQFPKGAA